MGEEWQRAREDRHGELEQGEAHEAAERRQQRLAELIPRDVDAAEEALQAPAHVELLGRRLDRLVCDPFIAPTVVLPVRCCPGRLLEHVPPGKERRGAVDGPVPALQQRHLQLVVGRLRPPPAHVRFGKEEERRDQGRRPQDPADEARYPDGLEVDVDGVHLAKVHDRHRDKRAHRHPRAACHHDAKRGLRAGRYGDAVGDVAAADGPRRGCADEETPGQHEGEAAGREQERKAGEETAKHPRAGAEDERPPVVCVGPEGVDKGGDDLPDIGNGKDEASEREVHIQGLAEVAERRCRQVVHACVQEGHGEGDPEARLVADR
mmetsp:Transcript_11492/g.27283  ORF Transcript_11492/g.27283 Transcript_11492/m.27283 type:complete len:321 (+) Transcript_11492:807-1769(+)